MHLFAAKLGALAMAPLMFFGGFGHATQQNQHSNPVYASTNNQQSALAITSVTGPSSLALNTSGTWDVNVTSAADTNLHYSVTWGDEAATPALRSMALAVNSSGTFTHTYSSAGTYTPEFTVTDDNGHTATKSVTVVVGVQAKLHLNAVTPTTGSVGDTVTISGTGFTSSSTVTLGGVAGTGVVFNADSTLTFVVPQLANGTYNVRVQNGTHRSNAVTFKVRAAASAISINGIDAPVSLTAGTAGTWHVNVATTADNLHYSVVWGDEGTTTVHAMALTSTVQSSSTFTHTYQNAGTYAPKFTITDDAGHSESVSASVLVRDNT